MKFKVDHTRLLAMAMKLASDCALALSDPNNCNKARDILGVEMQLISIKEVPREVTISYAGRTVGIVRTDKNWCLPRFGKAEAYDKWKENVIEYLYRQLTKLHVETYIRTDESIKIWEQYIPTYQDNCMSIPPYIFVGKANDVRNEFTVKGDYLEVVYQVKKVNMIGMTVNQGYQNFNAKNIMSELNRTLVTLLQNNHEFKIEVDM